MARTKIFCDYRATAELLKFTENLCMKKWVDVCLTVPNSNLGLNFWQDRDKMSFEKFTAHVGEHLAR